MTHILFNPQIIAQRPHRLTNLHLLLPALKLICLFGLIYGMSSSAALAQDGSLTVNVTNCKIGYTVPLQGFQRMKSNPCG